MDKDKRPILGVIPARGGSKRIPDKNLVELCGKPLIQYTVEAAHESGAFDRLILSTDDEQIAAVGRDLGVEVPFIRPKKLAEDETKMPAVVQHAIQWTAAEGIEYASVAILQPTSPLRRSSDIAAAVTEYLENDVDSLVGVCPPREDPFDLLIPDGNRARMLIPKDERPAYSKFYFLSGAFYLLAARLVLEKGISYTEKMAVFEMDWISSLDVATYEDLELAEALMQNRLRSIV